MEQELKDRIVQFNLDKVDLQNDIESFCSDKSVDLSIRWELFRDSGLGKVASDAIEFNDLGLNLYEDMNRHVTVDLIYQIDEISSWIENYGNKSIDELSEHMRQYLAIYTPELVIQMKERLLDLFVKACVHDW
jgi:hypothetical protein